MWHSPQYKAYLPLPKNGGVLAFLVTCKRLIYNLYIWFLQKTNMSMTKEQWYEVLLNRCNSEFDIIKNYLEEKPKPYLSFIGINENKLEFKVGSRKVLLIYHIDIKHLKVAFKTYEIVMNEDDYGKFKLNEIKELGFDSVDSDPYYLGADGFQLSMPNGYLNKLEKQFDTI